MNEIQRLTTEYIEHEDRIRISGELAPNETVVMWLSQRLLLRLLPHLFLWLDTQTSDTIPLEIAQSFEQEAAKSDLASQPPVERHDNSKQWLVTEVGVTPSQSSLSLTFRSSSAQHTLLSLPIHALRQWLSVLRALWVSANWPNDMWPAWIAPPKDDNGPEIAVH